MHKRKSSKEDPSANPIVDQNNSSTPPSISILAFPPSPPRSRVHSTSNSLPPLGPGIPARNKVHVPPPLGAGVGIPARRPPSISLNSPPTSPYRTSFTAHNPNAHSRTRSISSGPFVPPISSPLSTSFPAHVPLHPFPFPSSSIPEINRSDGDLPLPSSHTRRHSRLHSRNLSIFFPRPHATISEDERPGDEEAPTPQRDPVLIPASQSESALGPGAQIGRELNAGFTFGGISKSLSEPSGMRSSGPGVTTRRGHHHKHSLSHNFFSFLDPAKAQALSVPSKGEGLHSTPTETPISPWSPISNTSLLVSPNMAAAELIPSSQSKSPSVSRSNSTSPVLSKLGVVPSENVSTSGIAAIITAIGQFTLGALLWVRGQSIGSLACTGLGYWVVFDAIGVAGPAIVARQMEGKGNGMYGPARYGTSLLFAQCVYLMFAGVYVAKEAVEHLLLSAGGNAHGHGHGGGATGGDGGDGHHHHWGDERPENLGLRFPVLLILLVLLSLTCTSVAFGQHEVLVDITNKHIPSPLSLFRRGYQATPPPREQRSGVKRISRNPYVLPPVLFCMAILGAEVVLDVAHYAPFDLALAALEVIVTTHVAYAACVVLGGVLLQTAPPMAAPGIMGRAVVSTAVSGPAGRMEAFWRVVREIERHEHVLHLPAPHVWQVVPAGQPRLITGSEAPASEFESRNRHAHSSGHARHHGGHNHDHQHHDHAHNNHDRTHNHDHDHDHHDHDSNAAPKQVLGGLRTTSPALIITLSPHVRSSLADADVLALTQWASARVLMAFGKDGKSGEVEVTVGVVRD
ncbi:hypothetical protein PAXRUDRAFT_826640 [Paxillus rubicundulus Ve08.2h10]|uniref:Uncharacterized protein n=1 Tax=Paxillus rubicundulus Ve08.2h10 TaxID=930991 RepID=A0A0D0E420_9AGAM|nr:hypothetical protein PAXRUDRAFT_826640 [Paxillus rubicundulus Ve08.2h10]